MADFGIKPDIALSAAGPKRTGISDLIGTATKAMEYSRLSELYPELIKKTTAEAAAAKTGAEKAEMGFNLDKAKTITNGQISMIYNPLVVAAAQGKPVDRQALVNAVIDNAKVQSQNAGIDWETQGKKLAAPYISLAENDPAKLQDYFKERMLAGLDDATRAGIIAPKPEMIETGGAKLPVSMANELITGIKPGTPVGVGYTTQAGPQLMATETGAPAQFGGGLPKQVLPNQMVPLGQSAPPAPQIAPPAQQTSVAPPTTKPAPSAVSAVQQGFARQGGLQRAPDETYAAFQARSAELAKLPRDAAELLNPKNVESIPTMEYTNDRILKLMENPNLKIGPISKAIADRTGGVGLSAEQQEIQKYLEQRIRQEGSRSNQDQESQRMSFGNFGTNKDALRTIIYNDKAILAAQRLFHEGVKKAQGNPNSPNLGAINLFRENFNELAGDRDLMHYIGVVGNKSFDKLSATDKNQLRSYFAGKSQDPGKLFDDLEARRTELLKLVRGGK
jgi:hypothetical protein